MLYQTRKPFNSEDFFYIAEIDFQLMAFREYIKLTDEIIKTKVKDKIEEYDKLLKDDNPEMEQWYDVIDHEIKFHTKELYYNSVFISLYSFLEKKMYQLCKVAETNLTIKVKDFAGDGVVKYYNYLNKAVNINMGKINSEWELITKLNKLRNIFVHSPTQEIEKNENNRHLIEKMRSINNLTVIDRVDSVYVHIGDEKFLIDFCSLIDHFLRKIYYEEK